MKLDHMLCCHMRQCIYRIMWTLPALCLRHITLWSIDMAGSILGFLSSLKAFRARASAASTNLFFEGDNADLSCDRAGNLWVRNADAPAGTAVSPGVDI